MLSSGFANEQQDATYNKFLERLVQIMSHEILMRMRVNQDGRNADSSSFCKKIIKIYKAMKVMETQKKSEPRFSSFIKELAYFVYAGNDSASVTISKISPAEFDTTSNFTGINNTFNIHNQNNITLDRENSLKTDFNEKKNASMTGLGKYGNDRTSREQKSQSSFRNQANPSEERPRREKKRVPKGSDDNI